MSVKLLGPFFFFFLMGFVFCDSYYSTDALCTRFTLVFIMFVSNRKKLQGFFVGLALVGKDIVFRFIIEYSNLRDFDP